MPAHGQLKRGDEILFVNGVNVENMHEFEIRETIEARDSVQLVVKGSVNSLEELENCEEKQIKAKEEMNQCENELNRCIANGKKEINQCPETRCKFATFTELYAAVKEFGVELFKKLMMTMRM